MALPDKVQANRIILRFGAGINTVSSPNDVDPLECVTGSQNFDLVLDNNETGRRPAFDLVATATNGERINGFVQLQKQDGTLSTLVQAGGTVYEWDGTPTGFTAVGTVSSGARLRGPRQANWTLDEKAIITDLALLQPVMEWDGTTFQEMTTGLATEFFAKYCLIFGERGYFANVKATTATPHMIVGSALSDINSLTVTNRPSSTLAVDDPFYLLAPDLKPINGIVGAFGLIDFSTSRGKLFKLTGTDSTDFAIAELYQDSGAVGDESMAFIGNDVAYGRPGKIETLYATNQLGDVATDDLSRPISNLVENIDDWLVLFNPRFQRIYFFSQKEAFLGVFYKAFLDQRIRKIAERTAVPDLSPWSIWKTNHSLNFQPTAAMVMRRPSDGLEITYIGGPDGGIYELEGRGGQDGGTADIDYRRRSRIFDGPPGANNFDMTCWLSYKRMFAADLDVTFEFGGRQQGDQPRTITLAASTNVPVFGGGSYFGGDTYFGHLHEGRYKREIFDVPGQGEQFQVVLETTGAIDFKLSEIGIEFKAV